MVNKILNIVYVLVSSPNDYFCEELYCSLCTLRKHNADAEVTVLMDRDTKNGLVGERAMVLDLVDHVIDKDYDKSVSAHIRSRDLKTSMRNLVQGDFLYLDLDTLIADSVFDVPDDANIGMVLDGHKEIEKNNTKQKIIDEMARKTNRKYKPVMQYFNSGVIYCRETDYTYKFFDCWNKLYHEWLIKFNCRQDQYSMNYLIQSWPSIVEEMPGVWNVQLDCGVKYLSKAKVLHYLGLRYSSSNIIPRVNYLMHEICDESIFAKLRENRFKIDDKLKNIIDYPCGAIKLVRTVPRDSIADKILSSYSFLLLLIIYKNANFVFRVVEKVLNKCLNIVQSIKKYRGCHKV